MEQKNKYAAKIGRPVSVYTVFLIEREYVNTYRLVNNENFAFYDLKERYRVIETEEIEKLNMIILKEIRRKKLGEFI